MFETINKKIKEILEIDTLPQEEQKSAADVLMGAVYQEVMLHVLDEMEEEDKKVFEQLIESTPSPEVLLTFLSEKVPNFLEIVSEEAENIKSEKETILSESKK